MSQRADHGTHLGFDQATYVNKQLTSCRAERVHAGCLALIAGCSFEFADAAACIESLGSISFYTSFEGSYLLLKLDYFLKKTASVRRFLIKTWLGLFVNFRNIAYFTNRTGQPEKLFFQVPPKYFHSDEGQSLWAPTTIMLAYHLNLPMRKNWQGLLYFIAISNHNVFCICKFLRQSLLAVRCLLWLFLKSTNVLLKPAYFALCPWRFTGFWQSLARWMPSKNSNLIEQGRIIVDNVASG